MWRSAFLTIGLLLSGCSSPHDKAIQHDIAPSPRPDVRLAQTSTTTTVPSTTSNPPSRVVVSAQTTSPPPLDVEQCARRFVEAIIRGDADAALALADRSAVDAILPWIGQPIDAEVIDVVVLARAAGRARIGVGIAFAPAADGTITEPVAYVVDTVEGVDGCRVTAVGYA
jgi:hypothetical protein